MNTIKYSRGLCFTTKALHQAFNNPACKHKSNEERVVCAIDKSQGV